MASRKPKIHGFKQIQKDIKEDTVKNIILLCGREDYLIRWSAQQIKSRYINPAVEMFDFTVMDGSVAGIGEIIDSCETMPMMSERRVVLVQDFDMESEGIEELSSYLESFPETTILMLICGVPDRRRKIYKNILKYGVEYEFTPLSIPQLKAFISKRFKASGKQVDPNAVELLTELSGYYDKDSEYTLDNLVNDIQKITSHSGNVITLEDVEESVSGNVDRNVFAFSDALAAGRKGEALSMLSVLMSYGENIFKLLGLICSQFEVVLLVSEMRRDGMNLKQMQEQLNIHEYRIKKSMSLASEYSPKRLRNILMKAYEADRNIKSGLTEPQTALELFVAEV